MRSFPRRLVVTGTLGAALVLCSPTLAQDEAAGTAGEAPAGAAAGEGSSPTGGAPKDGDNDLSSEATQTAEDIGGGANEGTGKSLAERIPAVSRPVFVKAGRFEAAPLVGFSLNDAFYQRITGGARFSYHILESLSVDVGGAFTPLHVPLPTVRFLNQVGAELPNTPIFWGYVDGGVTFAPIYGKFSLMGEYVVHFDFFGSAGIGAVIDSHRRFLWGMDVPSPFIPSVHPAVQVGVGGRVFLFKWLAVRVDVKDYIYLVNRADFGAGIAQAFWPPGNMAMVNIALAFYFPFGFEYDYQAQ